MMRLRKQSNHKHPRPEKPDGLTMFWRNTKSRTRAAGGFAARKGGDLWQEICGTWDALCSVVARLPVPLLVFALCMAVYAYRPIVQGLDDNVPLRFGAMQIAVDGKANWEVLSEDVTSGNGFSRNVSGNLVSHTPIGTAVLGAVFFRAALFLGFDMSPENIVFFDCFGATIITAFTMAMFAWLVRRQGRRTAFLMAMLFAFGTAAWGVASRQLWQHTGELFWLMAGLCVLDGASRRGARLLIASLFFGLAVWCRPQALPVVVILMGYQWRRNWRVGIVAAVILFVLLCAWMLNNRRSSGTILGTYLHLALADAFPKFTVGNILRGMFGAYFSPNVGLCFFSPLVFVGLLCITPWKFMRVLWTEQRTTFLTAAGAFALMCVLGLTVLSNVNALYLGAALALVLCGGLWSYRTKLISIVKTWWRGVKNQDTVVLIWATWAGIITRGLVPNWAGWNAFGGRYMLDFIPCMLLVMVPLVHALVNGDVVALWGRKRMNTVRVGVVVAVVLSGFVQWMGVTRESNQWNAAMWDRYRFRFDLKAWEWRRPLLLHVLTHGRHTAGWPSKPENYLLPADGKIELKSGANPYVWYGMGQGEPFGWWTVPPNSGLAITIPKQGWYKIRFTVAGASYVLDPSRVDFYWNGAKVGEHLFEGGYLEAQETQWYDLPRDVKQLNIGQVSDLEFRTSRSFYGWLAGQGATGIAVAGVEIKEF